MASLTLDSIIDEAHDRYADTVVTVGDEDIVLLNPLRMSKERRQKLSHVGQRMKGEDADQVEVLSDALVTAAKTPAAGKRLVKAIDGDLTTLSVLFEKYMASTQAGEA